MLSHTSQQISNMRSLSRTMRLPPSSFASRFRSNNLKCLMTLESMTVPSALPPGVLLSLCVDENNTRPSLVESSVTTLQALVFFGLWQWGFRV